MPPSTVSDNITLMIQREADDDYYLKFDTNHAFAVMDLCNTVYKLPDIASDSGIFDAIRNYLEAFSTEEFSFELTVEAFDLHGNSRPYNCDPLVNYLFGTALREYPYIGFGMYGKTAIQTIKKLMTQTIAEPLFEWEKNGLVEVLNWLETKRPSRLFSWYKQGI